jgi:carbonic anhydrase
MKKLIQGIADFRKHRLADYREKFGKLSLGQSPDTLFIACSDSRVVPNLFASTDPGELFVIRNVGNFVPPCREDGHSDGDVSAWAAVELSIHQLNVSDIVVCGHSECGAIQAIVKGRREVEGVHLRMWLEYGEGAIALMPEIEFSEGLAAHNKVSQANVLLQIRHLETYPLIRERMNQGRLNMHGWWFEIGSGLVYSFNKSARKFELIGG